MDLGLDTLLALVSEHNLVEKLGARDLKNPEGAGFDLRANALFEFLGPGFLGVENRSTSNTPDDPIIAYDEKESRSFLMPPETSYLVQTIEVVHMPLDIQAFVTPRTTLFRCDVSLETAKVNPGYHGALTFRIRNDSKHFPFTLEMGARIAHISFQRIDGTASLYRGQWQGGRVSTTGLEKQT